MRKYIPLAVAAMVLVAATTRAEAQAAQQPKESSLKAAAQEYSFEIRPTTGLVIPLAPSGDVGWNIGASLRAMPPSWPVGLQLDVMWIDLDGSLFQFTGDVVYAFGGSEKVKPYVIGGLGMYDGDFGLNGGFGADLAGSGPIGFFGEARFHAVFRPGDNLNLIPINLGVRIRF